MYNQPVYHFHLVRSLEWSGCEQTSFCYAGLSWVRVIGSPPTGGAGRMKLSCVVPTSVIHILTHSYILNKIIFHLRVSTISAFWFSCWGVIKNVFIHSACLPAICPSIDPSWGGPIELFLIPASAPQLV